MTRRLAQLAVTILALASAAPSALAAGGVGLTEAGGARFPVRAFVVSLPSDRSLSAGDVQVTENGQAVADVQLVAAAAAARKAFGVVLLIDTSESMAGKPLAGALAAARSFVARRSPNQQIAIVTFNSGPSVTLPFTTAPEKIIAALATKPAVAYGTHIYDAVGRALDLLQQADIQSGSVVVLSDGADTGSTASVAGVLEAARANHVRLFTIGLRSRRFDPGSLQRLATVGGAYAEARSAAELTPLYKRLSAELSREYLLTYKSLASPQRRVNVRVQVSGAGAARSAYVTPALKVAPPVGPYHESLVTRILTSALFMVLIALLCTAALVWTAVLLLQPGSSDLRRRMSNFVSLTSPAGPDAGPRRTVLSGVLDDAEGRLEGRKFWARLNEALEIADIKTSASRLVGLTLVATLLLALFLDVALSGLFVVLAVVVPLGVRSWVLWKLRSKRKKFAEQLPDSLEVLASALRAGHSLVGALSVVVESGAEPMKSEFARVVADEQLGVPLEDALGVVVRRMDNRDLEQVALVAKLQREMGGNAAEVVDRVTETVRERFELRRLVKTLTAQGRLSRWVVSFLPVGLFLLISLLNPHYFHPLWSHTAGRALVVLAILLVLGGSWVIKRIVDIKV